MSTSQSRPAMAIAGNSQCMDAPGDFERYFDFSNLGSPTVGSSQSRMPSQAASALTSPTTHLLPLDVVDEHAVLQPSHEYTRFRQQTSLPTSIEQLQYLNSTPSGMFPGYNSGIDELGLGLGGTGAVTSDMAPFYYTASDSQGSDFIDPTEIIKQEEAQAHVRFYPGMHQQAARQAEQQKQQQQQLMLQKQREAESRRSHSRRSVSSQPLDPRTEETIARVVNQIRQNSNMPADAASPSNSVLPHIVRSKKDEDDMDEDERLLNSEEGKKLSSKERRQLRNKVSARAFRSRRKEYISQLEGELAIKVNEAKELQLQNSALMEENARFHALTQKLLGHAAFRPFLEELSRDPSVSESLSKVAGSNQAMLATSSAPEAKDMDPYSNGQQQYLAPQNNVQHVGMTFIPETPIDLSSLNLGPSGNNGGWAMPNGLPTFQQQVFAVTELPSIPESIDFEALSGKDSSNDIFSELSGADEDVKHDYPEIESPKATLEEPLKRPSNVEEVDEGVFDEDDPSFTLFAASSSSSSSSVVKDPEDCESLFGDIAPEKAFARFELFVSDESDNQLLMDRFERMCARLDTRVRRLDALLDGYL